MSSDAKKTMGKEKLAGNYNGESCRPTPDTNTPPRPDKNVDTPVDLESDLTEHFSAPLDHFDQQCAASVDNAAPPIPIGELAGCVHQGYRLLQIRGVGGQGIVYEAYHHHLARKVAIKVVPFSQSMEGLAREAKQTAQLSGTKGVAWIFDFFDHPESNTMWIVMEWLEGETVLEHIIRQSEKQMLPPYEWREVFKIVVDVLDTLGQIHWRKNGRTAHSDIKPSNIFVTSSGEVKLIDFGLAVPLDQDFGASGRITRNGTPLYMAPELFPFGTDAVPDFRLCDIYSLGATLHHMLTGSPPILSGEKSLDLHGIWRKHSDENRPDPCATVKNLPGCCRAVVARSMAIDPSNRYPTAEEFRKDLLSELNRHSEPARRSSGRMALLVAGGIAVLALAAIQGRMINRPQNNPRSLAVQASASPKLTRLVFKVRRDEDEPTLLWDVLSPNTIIDRVIRPGNAQSGGKDCLQIDGEFDRPTRWHILWHDSNGNWMRACSSDGEQTIVLYPVPSPGKEVIYVTDTDPPGTQVIFLISGSVTEDQIDALIAKSPVKEPPPANLARHIGEVRGPSSGQGVSIAADGRYLAAVREWIPAGVTTAKFIAIEIGQR